MSATGEVTTLDVRVTALGADRAQYAYRLLTPGGAEGGPLEQEYSVEVPQHFVRQLSDRIDQVLQAALGNGDDRGAEHHAELAEHGGALYRALFPRVHGSVPDLVARLNEATGPLLVRTNEMTVPWELVHDGTGFLGLTRDLGRFSVVQRRVVKGRAINGIRRALIVGDPLGDLAASAQEAEHLAAWLSERGTDCTLLLRERANLVDVQRELANASYDLFHFCGHVARDNESGAGLMLHGRSLLDKAMLQVIPSTGVPPVVFINGCDSAGRVANLCVAFMASGAKAVVGTRAEVAEDGARRFAEEFYQRLLSDSTVGRAVREARAELMDGTDAAWASFLLYANPAVRIGGAPPDVPGEHRPKFDTSVVTMLGLALNLAADRRLLTSQHLLLGLVTMDEVQEGMAARVGPGRLAAITRELRRVVAEIPVMDPPPEPEDADMYPILSDTVTRVLYAAEDRATAGGRDMVGLQDVAAAFVEVGGGTATRSVTSGGVSLRLLLGQGADAVAGDAVEPASSANRALTNGGTGNGAVPAELFSELFNGDGRLRADLFETGALNALRTALLVSRSQGTVIASYSVLLGFAMTGSAVLRDALAEQGETGETALRGLGPSAEPRRSAFSKRTLTALERARTESADGRIGEAAVLRALLADPSSAARELLTKLGVDGEALIEALRRAD
ncbi:CHAT domain-containing protein [Actinomadura hibisca]|uniref:CHAT domain-containing protein n=1 Tax=Actinomadura hibisca TaxID=68565 RepID=UPI0008339F42|nr:CHAT domain-containing protein [Actinomadura hibisca]